MRLVRQLLLVCFQCLVVKARENDRQVFAVELPSNLDRHFDSSIEGIVVNPRADRRDCQTADLMLEGEGEDAFIAGSEKVWFPSLSI